MDNINVWVKDEEEEYPAEPTSGINQFLEVNALKVEEFSQDYDWSEQSSSIEPNFVHSKIETEDDLCCSVSPDFLMPIKQEPELDIPTGEDQFEGQKVYTCYHCGHSRTSLEELRRHIRRQHKFILKRSQNETLERQRIYLVNVMRESGHKEISLQIAFLKEHLKQLCNYPQSTDRS